MEEIYKAYFNDYEVSNIGNVRRKLINGSYKELKCSIQNRGYKYFQQMKDGKKINHLVHHVVAKLFIGERPENQVIDHIDRNKLNNKVTPGRIQNSTLIEEYKQKFNRVFTASGLYTWLRNINDPDLKKRTYIKSKEKKLVFGAKYLLYVNQETICGFETVEEVKEFLQTNLILTGQKLCLYEKKELGIKYDIEIK